MNYYHDIREISWESLDYKKKSWCLKKKLKIKVSNLYVKSKLSSPKLDFFLKYGTPFLKFFLTFFFFFMIKNFSRNYSNIVIY